MTGDVEAAGWSFQLSFLPMDELLTAQRPTSSFHYWRFPGMEQTIVTLGGNGSPCSCSLRMMG